MARRQIPMHESMVNPRRPGILESLAERLGVDQAADGEAPDEVIERAADTPNKDTENAGGPVQSQEGAAQPSQIGTTEVPQAPAPPRPRTPARVPKEPPKKPETPSVDIDGRIVAAKGKQALYVRLPREMHEFLEDLSYRLSKTNRDASMTNLVAQAIADKYPESLEAREDAG